MEERICADIKSSERVYVIWTIFIAIGSVLYEFQFIFDSYIVRVNAVVVITTFSFMKVMVY